MHLVLLLVTLVRTGNADIYGDYYLTTLTVANAIHHEEVEGEIGGKVVLLCNVSSSSSSISWRRRAFGKFNEAVLWNCEAGCLSMADTSGRMSLLQSRNGLHLVIHELQKTDSGTYACFVGNTEHITALKVSERQMWWFDSAPTIKKSSRDGSVGIGVLGTMGVVVLGSVVATVACLYENRRQAKIKTERQGGPTQVSRI